MKACPNCSKQKLIEIADTTTEFTSRVCLDCAYYESDTEAFTLHPWMFADLGTNILARIKEQLAMKGLAENEAQDWLEQEPDFSRRIVTPLENRREGTSA